MKRFVGRFLKFTRSLFLTRNALEIVEDFTRNFYDAFLSRNIKFEFL